jgi:tetratricopeptide (TPR) repeat protein
LLLFLVQVGILKAKRESLFYLTKSSGSKQTKELPLYSIVFSMNQTIDKISSPTICLLVTSSPQEEKMEGNISTNPVLAAVLLDLEKSQTEGDQQKIAEAWNSLGLVRLHTQHNTKEAIICHKKALKMCIDPVETAITLNDLGFCYERLNEHDQAMQVYKQAMQLLGNRLADSHPRKLGLERNMARLLRM